MIRRLLSAVCIAAAISSSPLAAHEFWLSPPSYQIPVGAPLVSHIRVGQGFKGSAFSYLERSTSRFDVIQGNNVFASGAVIGDRPALQRVVAPEGLAIVVHETTDSRLTYNSFEQFTNFVTHKDFAGALERHEARRLPETGFVETYRRYAKSLISVGKGEGIDVAVGLDTEIVALKNPYTEDLSGEIPVQVFLYGAPRGDVQVELFSRDLDADPTAETTITLHRTNAEGIVLLPIEPGKEYMVDAVVLEERNPEEEGDGAAWHSMWANLTFAVPAQ